MREIKFRAWDGKKMFNVDVLAISKCGWSCPDYGYKGVSLAFQPSIKVMQCTGLKDKNGVEIYEGDIWKSSENGIEEIGVVGYYGCAFRVKYGDMSDLLGLAIRYGEVVGNIYENPDLLEQQPCG